MSAEVVREFYRAVAASDADAVRALVRDRFAEDATLTWPEALPYGGTVAGRDRLAKVLGGAAASTAKVGAQDLRLLELADGGDRVAAEVAFDYYPPGGADAVASRAVEFWEFADGLVTAVRAYYWDTAALVR
jgi:ketosteroid isomerase-like protein